MSKRSASLRRLGLAQARMLWRARPGPPTESDRPWTGGRAPRVLDGQLDIDGNVHRTHTVIYERQEEKETDE